MRQAHYYRGLYPYTYSAGLTIRTRVAQAIQKRSAGRRRWVEVLKLGGTKKPTRTRQTCKGVDIEQPARGHTFSSRVRRLPNRRTHRTILSMGLSIGTVLLLLSGRSMGTVLLLPLAIWHVVLGAW